jgi:LysM repeat protein
VRFKLVSLYFLALVTLFNAPSLVQAKTNEASINVSKSYSISHAVLDEENGYIYAIAAKFMENPERLLFIDQHDLKVKADIEVGHAVELEFSNGKIYVLNNASRITVVDIKTKSIEKRIGTFVQPEHIEVHGDKLFYVDNKIYSDLRDRVYVLDLKNGPQFGLETVDGDFSSVDIEVDPIRNILYIAEMHDPSRDKFPRIQAINAADLEYTSSRYYNPNKEFLKNAHLLIADGNDVFYAGYRFNANNLNIVYGSYGDKDIRYVKGNTVFTSTAAYDRVTFKKIKNIEKPFLFIDSQNYAYSLSVSEGDIIYFDKWPLFIEKLTEVYTVKSGDSLWKISQRFGTSMYALITLNELDPSKHLMVGQILKIPYVKEILERPKPIGIEYLHYHSIVEDESLSEIAQKYNLTVGEITAVNYIYENKLTEGMRIMIPIYKVIEGDTAWKIASGMGMTLNELVQLNNLKDPAYLEIGQILKIKVPEVMP